jgi:uncharacterized BrkB/YihY/UPF0761 family membrane protein
VVLINIPALDAISEFISQIASNPTVMTVLLTLIIAITLGELFKRVFKKGLIKKVGVKRRSPIYDKKPWAKALDINRYVRREILQEKSSN